MTLRTKNPDITAFGISRKLKIVLIILSIFASVKMLFFAYGLDEEYQIVMSYRNAMGDHLFYNMWEPHQSSAFLCAALIKLYMAVAGTTTGIVIFLRFCGTLIHLTVSALLYKTLIGRGAGEFCLDEQSAFLISCIYFNTIPKQIMTPEFGIMQVWFFTLMMLCFVLYSRKNQIRYVILAAVCMALEVLSYPSCIVLYFFALFVIWRMTDAGKGGRWKACLIFTGICALLGFCYLGLLLRQQSLQGLIGTLGSIVGGDVTHSLSAADKIKSFLLCLIVLFLFTISVYMLSVLTWSVRVLQKRKKGILEPEQLPGAAQKRADQNLYLIIWGCIFQILFWLLLKKGYEVMQLHLLVITLVGISSYRQMPPEKKKKLGIWQLTIWGSLISLLAVTYLTDLTLLESMSHAMMAAFAGMILYVVGSLEGGEKKRKGVYLALIIWAFTAIFGKGFMLRAGVDYYNILQSRGIMKEGPAAGTISNYMGAYVYNCDYEDWEAYMQDGDRVLIVVDQVMNLGTTQYLFKDVEVSHFSIVNPTAYDERLLEYWEQFPDKKPNVIIVDCWYGQLMTDPDSYIMHYVENEFGYTECLEGRYIRIYRKGEGEQ